MIIIFTSVVCSSVRSYFSKSHKTKQLSCENSDRHWRGSGSGRVDHWKHTRLVHQFLKVMNSSYRKINVEKKILCLMYDLRLDCWQKLSASLPTTLCHQTCKLWILFLPFRKLLKVLKSQAIILHLLLLLQVVLQHKTCVINDPLS